MINCQGFYDIMRYKYKIYKIIIGLIALTFGGLIYIVERPGSIYFLKLLNFSYYCESSNIFSFLGNFFCNVTYTYSLIFFMSSIFEDNKTNFLIISIFWFVFNAVFEIGQYYKYKAIKLAPNFFKDVLFLENFKNYCINGTFDFFDLGANFIGAFLAFFSLYYYFKQKEE